MRDLRFCTFPPGSRGIQFLDPPELKPICLVDHLVKPLINKERDPLSSLPPRKERWEKHDELEGMKGRICIKLLPQLVWLIAMAPNLADGGFGISRIASVSEVREVMCSEAAATLFQPIGGILRGGGERRGGARVKRRIACVSSAPASRPLTCMRASFL